MLSKQIKTLFYTIFGLLLFGLISCKKENSTGFTAGKGAPTITSVHTLSKTLTDTIVSQVQTYDTIGNTTTVTDSNFTHQSVTGFDSTTVTGNKGQYYVIYGTNLGSATTVMFNGVSVYFNRALISDHSIVVLIPLNIPTFGDSATNKLTVITLHGTATYNFTVLTPPPTIATISDYDFWAGSQITFTGVGFASVNSVGLTGTTDTCSIISKTDAQIVIQFPSTMVDRTNLVFSYISQGSTVKVTTTQEFNDLDNAYNIFAFNNFQNGWQDASWQSPSGVATGVSHSYGGTASAEASYPAGGWKIEGWANWYPSFGFDGSYKYLTFWVKGGTANHTLVLVGDKIAGGYSQNTSAPAIQQISVPAGVWTYYKIPLGTAANELNYWANGTPAQQLGFFLQGQTGDVDETMYFDEVAFLK